MGSAHVRGAEADLHVHSRELRRDIVLSGIDFYHVVAAYLAGDAVVEGVLEPVAGSSYADVGSCAHVAVDGALAYAGVEGLVVGLDIVLQETVKLLQGSDAGEVEGRYPAAPEGSEVALHLSFRCTVPNLRMLFEYAEVAEDKGELAV